MKKLIEYYKETVPELNFKIKTIIELNEDMMLSLSSLLQKYGLKEITNIKKTILLPNPIDFPRYPYSEITIIDVVLTYPVSPYILQKEIIYLWNIPSDSVVVRNEYEASEQQLIDRDLDREILEKFNSMKNSLRKGSLLSTNQNSYPEEIKFSQRDLAGNLFNELFKEKLSSNRKNPYENFPLSYDNDYNKHIKDAPKVYPYDKEKEIEDSDKATSRWGNFWSELTRVKPFIDKNNNNIAIAAKYKRKAKNG